MTIQSLPEDTKKEILFLTDEEGVYRLCITCSGLLKYLTDSYFWREWLEKRYPIVKETYDSSVPWSYDNRASLLPVMERLYDAKLYHPLLELLRKKPESADLYIPYPIHQKIMTAEEDRRSFLETLLCDDYNYHVFGERPLPDLVDGEGKAVITSWDVTTRREYIHVHTKENMSLVFSVFYLPDLHDQSIYSDFRGEDEVGNTYLSVLFQSDYYGAGKYKETDRRCIQYFLKTWAKNINYRVLLDIIEKRNRSYLMANLDCVYQCILRMSPTGSEDVHSNVFCLLTDRFPHYLTTYTFCDLLNYIMDRVGHNDYNWSRVHFITVRYLTQTIGGRITLQKKEEKKINVIFEHFGMPFSQVMSAVNSTNKYGIK